MQVFVLSEEVDVIGIFSSRELAEKCAQELELHNFLIQEFTLEETENA